jgi:ribosome maturation factor RimP
VCVSFPVSKISGFVDIKVRIREIPVLDKLQYLHVLLSSVLPVVKQIHHDQCFEVELEKKLRGKMHFKVFLGSLATLNFY